MVERRIKPEDHTNHSNGRLHSEKAGSHPDHKTAFKPEHHTVHPSNSMGKKEGGKKDWIGGAIKHPGAEKKAAARAGESTHEYMEGKKDAPGKAGKRARLGLELEKMSTAKSDPKTKSYHSEPDGDETKTEATKPMKKGTTVTVSKPADIPETNKPGSYNTKTHPVVKPGDPALPAGETEGGGSKTTKGNPSYSPISSSNTAEHKDMHFHIHVANK